MGHSVPLCCQPLALQDLTQTYTNMCTDLKLNKQALAHLQPLGQAQMNLRQPHVTEVHRLLLTGHGHRSSPSLRGPCSALSLPILCCVPSSHKGLELSE